MEKIIKYYPEAWFKVEYEVDEIVVNFKAWKIITLNEEVLENSEIDIDEPDIEGYIKWDGCMNFKQDGYYCGIHHAKQTLMLMTEIYKFKGSLGGNFEKEVFIEATHDLSELVSFGNYLLSEKRNNLMSSDNAKTSVHDADIDQWKSEIRLKQK